MTAPILEERRPPAVRLVGFGLLFAAVAWGLATFSAFPWEASAPGAALLKVAFKHVAAFEREGRRLSPEELERLPRHMRPQGGIQASGGRRADTRLRIALDGRLLLERTYRPGGLRHDGPTFAYEELTVPVGRHRLEATLTDAHGEGDAGRAEDEGRRRWRLGQDVEVRAGQVVRLELADDAGLVLR